MKNHHTKEKGDVGVFKAMLALSIEGYVVLSPMTEHAPFDLVAYKDGKFLRIQVKYRKKNEGGVLYVKLVSSWSDKNGRHVSPIDKSDVDLYCIYCPDTDTCYYVNPDEFGSSITLRVDKPKSNQVKNIKFAKSYTEIPKNARL